MLVMLNIIHSKVNPNYSWGEWGEWGESLCIYQQKIIGSLWLEILILEPIQEPRILTKWKI